MKIWKLHCKLVRAFFLDEDVNDYDVSTDVKELVSKVSTVQWLVRSTNILWKNIRSLLKENEIHIGQEIKSNRNNEQSELLI